jgi:hypothetical protein
MIDLSSIRITTVASFPCVRASPHVDWHEQVIQSSMEPPGNNQCGTWSGVEFQVSCTSSIVLASPTLMRGVLNDWCRAGRKCRGVGLIQ